MPSRRGARFFESTIRGHGRCGWGRLATCTGKGAHVFAILQGGQGHTLGSGSRRRGLQHRVVACRGRKCAVAFLRSDDDRHITWGVVSPNWPVVLYALLRKPFPNNPALISGLPETALMAQDMKACLHMVRAAAYARVQSRIVNDQLGWAAGYGTGDIGLALQAVIQQSRRLGHSLFLLYMDLATFFPRIDRDIGTATECMHGLSAEVAWLVGLIYGGFDGKPGINCRFDTGCRHRGSVRDVVNAWLRWRRRPQLARATGGTSRLQEARQNPATARRWGGEERAKRRRCRGRP